jgi:hypothetical protein
MEGGCMSEATSSKTSSTRVGKQAVASLLSLLDWAEKQDFKLPADLSERHDEYFWENPQEDK